MKFTKREMALLVFLVGVTALIVLLVVRRECGMGSFLAMPWLKGENPGAVGMLRGNGAAAPAATNASDVADQPATGEDEAGAMDDAEFAERVRRIRPPPAGAADASEAARLAERKRARHADAGPQDANEIVRVLNQLASQPWSPQNAKLFQDALVKWGNQDPLAALDYAMSIESRRTRLAMLGTLIGNWARADPTGAYSWALANLQDDAGALEAALRPIFGALAGQNLDGAMRSLWAMPAGSGRSAALRAVVERAVRDGSTSEMAAYLSSITDPQEARLLASSLAQNWAVQDPLSAVEWAMSLSDPLLRDAALGSVVGVWTADQPEQVAAWIAQLPAGALRNQQMSRLTQTWAGFDPVGAADWLIEQQPPQAHLDSAVQGLVMTVMRSNPEGAMDWAGAISNPRLRNATLLQVGKRWLRQNPMQATSYILSSSLPPDVRMKLLQGK